MDGDVDGYMDGWMNDWMDGWMSMWPLELDGWNSDGLNGYEQTTSLTFKHLYERLNRYIDVDVQRGPNITANHCCICLSEHDTCAYADAVQICGNI